MTNGTSGPSETSTGTSAGDAPLRGRNALVTGSTRGLGRAVVETLARAGARVVVNGAAKARAGEEAAAAIRSFGAEAIFVRADVTTEEGVHALVSRAAEELGELDILVVNATPAQALKPLEESSWHEYQLMLDYFVKSSFLLSRHVVGGMKQRRHGRIISITSEIAHTGLADCGAYAAAKGGQVAWSRALACELAPFGITVNAVAPGWIPVERHAGAPPEAMEAYLHSIPAGRWGTPADVADAVLYFARDEASFVTGQTLCVNGGRTPR